MKDLLSRLRVVVAAAAVFLPSAGQADEASWQISKASGEVFIVAESGDEMPLGSVSSIGVDQGIRTGNNGRVLLTRGEDTIFISPGTTIKTPAKTPDGLTNILQTAGEIIFQVGKKSSPHFEVQTPYLVALVKGTLFRVSLAQDHSDVTVQEGKVEVADPKTGQFALILPGQQASVSASAPGLFLKGSGDIGPIENGQPFEALSPVGWPSSSNGAGKDGFRRGEIAVDERQVFRGLMIGIGLGLIAAIAFAYFRTKLS
ncbi:MAG: FecR family protein [Hyphomicrobium sp.]|jgi:hypothetical protein